MTTTTQPLFVQKEHILDLYYWVDTEIPRRMIDRGRPPALHPSETLTILIWSTLVLRQQTLKDIHRCMLLYHANDFQVPKYSAFVRHCHDALPHMYTLLVRLLSDHEAVRIMDSTMLPVSKPHRADRHKVAKGIAQFGKNWQGWHYGFKLHASVSLDGRLCGLALTPANVYDAQMEYRLLNQHTRVAVGDTLYGARVMRERMWRRYGTVIISPPWPSQKKRIATPWQIDLLNQRSKIETVFDYLKQHLQLVSSFPRSVTGYLVHYVRVLLSYQIMALLKGG